MIEMEVYGRALDARTLTQTPHFILEMVAVKATQEFVEELVTRTEGGTVYVSAEDFPVWLAAIGSTTFYTAANSSGRRFAFANKFMKPGHAGMLSVHCAESGSLPAWVTWPDGEGTRAHSFTAVAS